MRWSRFQIVVASLLSLLAVLCMSCQEEAKYHIKDVKLTMSVEQVSAGFVEVKCATNMEAYYLLTCVEADASLSPATYPVNTMKLALDSAYMKYIQWRYYLLMEGETYVADFSSHSLQYGSVDHFFNNLKPSTDYWLFAFVVDPKTNSPVGDLVMETITTDSVSRINVRFDYRVDDQWDYVYPLDSVGMILKNFPYAWITVDSADLRAKGYPEDMGMQPYLLYAYDTYNLWKQTGRLQTEISFGVNSTNNLNTEYEFQEGHTYYALIAGMDGGFSSRRCYKFTWHKGFKHRFVDPDDTYSAMW